MLRGGERTLTGNRKVRPLHVGVCPLVVTTGRVLIRGTEERDGHVRTSLSTRTLESQQ